MKARDYQNAFSLIVIFLQGALFRIATGPLPSALARTRSVERVQKQLDGAVLAVVSQLRDLIPSEEGAEIALLTGGRATVAAAYRDPRLAAFVARWRRLPELADRFASESDVAEVRGLLAREILTAVAILEQPGAKTEAPQISSQ